MSEDSHGWAGVVGKIPAKFLTWMAALAAVAFVALVVSTLISAHITGKCLMVAGAEFGHTCQVPPMVSEVPPGAVVAFDIKGACPKTWDPYKPAESKFILGAGNGELKLSGPHRPAGALEPIIKLKKVDVGDQGGTEAEFISISELPKLDVNFNRSFYEFYGNAISMTASGPSNVLIAGCPYNPGSTGECRDPSRKGTLISASIKGAEEQRQRNNMPPFVSLKFCVKSDVSMK